MSPSDDALPQKNHESAASEGSKLSFTGHSQEYWDARYRDTESAFGVEASSYLVDQKDRLTAGQTAFVPGDGEGRNSIWLAKQGLQVTAADLSAVGIAKGEQLAAHHEVAVNFLCQDLAVWDWPTEAFDVVVSVYFHLPPDLRPRLHRAMVESMKPGGLLIIEAFTPRQIEYQKKYRSGGPPCGEMMYTPELLREDFAGCEPLDLHELEVELTEGSHHVGLAHVVRGLFRRH